MWIKELKVHDYRAFQKEFHMNLSKNVTVIAGLNGVGKSTLLAILTNVGEVRKYKTLNGKPFRGEFSDVIMYDKGNDTAGTKATVTFAHLPADRTLFNVTPHLSFRASKHRRILQNNYYKYTHNKKTLRSTTEKSIIRYRLIPKKSKEHDNERKVVWPSYYMGLSRLTPIGEHDTAIPKKIPEQLSRQIVNDHKTILSENTDIDNTSISNFEIGTNFPKANIITNNYGYAANSNGQDNTGQIIEAVYSFSELKKQMEANGEEYIGGILAIDEFDATLHPAAQNRLLDWLLKKSQKLDLQIVFTTHSITLLEHASKIQKLKGNHEKIKINYLNTFSDNVGKVSVKENPDPNYYKYDLQQTYSNVPDRLTEVYVLSEDEVTRWFAQKLIDFSQHKELQGLNWLDVNISWSHMLNLYDAAPETFTNFFIVLDPDLNLDNKKSQLQEYINDHFVSFQVNSARSNVFVLPGSNTIETMIWTYLHSIPSDDSLFEDPLFIRCGITYDSIRIMDEETNNDPTHKHWFKNHRTIMDVVIKYWIRDHRNDVNKFIGILSSAYNRHTNQI